MNRRTFLSRVCGGVVGAAVVAAVPLNWIPAPIKRQGAIDFLLKHYRDATDGTHFRQPPTDAVVACDLFDAYESELIAFVRVVPRDYFAAVPNHTLMFKGVKLHRSSARGWFIAWMHKEPDAIRS